MKIAHIVSVTGVVTLAAACGSGGGGSKDGPASPSAPQSVVTTVSVAPVSGGASALTTGQTLQLGATPRDQSGLQIAAAITWTTSAAAVATVSSTGLVAAVGPGSATITATAAAGSAVATGTFTVTVATAPLLTTVAVSGTTSLSVGQTSQLTAGPRDQNGVAIAASVAWSSSAPAIASVSGSGLVTALAVGNTTISALATAGAVNVTGTAAITVQPTVATLSSLSLTPGLTSLQVGQTQQFTAVALDQSGNPITASISWSTSAPGVASVSQTGLVTAVATGAVVITAQATASGVTLTATRNMTIAAVTPVLTSVSISSSTTTMTVGQTLQLSAAARDQFGANIGASINWASSNTGRATVSSSGLVTAVAGGSVTITVSAAAGSITVLDAITLTLQALPVLSSVVISGPATVAAGSTIQLTAAPKDQFGNAISGATVAWSSSNPGFATVNPTSGLVTGVAAGSPSITASATLGSANASSFVTIAVTGGFPLSASVSAVGLSFSPATVNIGVGATVSWGGLAGHDVTFDTPGAPGGISGASSGSLTFSVPPGAYAYHCSIHGAGMAGAVVVH